MTNDETFIFIIGLTFVSFSVGSLTETLYGYFTFGGGLIVGVLLNMVYRILKRE